MGIDDRKSVDERAQHLVNRLLPPGMQSHPLDESSLVAPIAEDAGMVVSRYDREELFEDVALLVLAIGPKRIAMLAAAIADDHPNQVDEALLWVTLCVQVDPHRTGRHVRCSEDVDCLMGTSKN